MIETKLAWDKARKEADDQRTIELERFREYRETGYAYKPGDALYDTAKAAFLSAHNESMRLNLVEDEAAEAYSRAYRNK